MISKPDREEALKLIDEAVDAGAALEKACRELELSVRTYHRWKRQMRLTGVCRDLRPDAVRPEPKNKLTAEEKAEIIRICNVPANANKSPWDIVAELADQGLYVASESSFYRVLREYGMNHHRGRAAAPEKKTVTSFCATAKNQVWVWDITYLHGPIKGIFYYLYLITDLFSRDSVGWEVWEEESAEHASELIQKACLKQGITFATPLVLHSDNGSPMKGSVMLETLYRLGITPSNSRPRVSNDNAYAESNFKTLKYRPDYPCHGFASLEEARIWVKGFINWYRNEHHHSGIKFLTPAQCHSGEGESILARRHKVYEDAKAKNPVRWNGRKTRDWTMPTEVWLNPERSQVTYVVTAHTKLETA